MKKYLSILSPLLFLAALVPSPAQERDSLASGGYSDLYLDTVRVEKVRQINDYTLIGVNGGATFSRMSFNPPHKQSIRFSPSYFSLTYTRYGKMFGYMPYFGFQTGIAYGHEGFLFKPDSETGITYTVDGATEMVMDVVEVPFLAQIHVDSDFFKVMVNAGIYGGYRLNVERTGPSLTATEAVTFKETDIRFDYGLQGGVSLGIIFDPVELHFGALVRYSWSSIYTPDSSNSVYNKYYYRYAYPFDVMVTAGVHFQITKRRGRTSHDIKREAYDYVYKNDSGQDR
ncbi:MAG: PorT family protein [Bacteroidales bacterium]|nr:PorT family protein [Bacteroidales bacterium]